MPRGVAAGEGGAGRPYAATGVGRGDSKPAEIHPQAFILVVLVVPLPDEEGEMPLGQIESLCEGLKRRGSSGKRSENQPFP